MSEDIVKNTWRDKCKLKHCELKEATMRVPDAVRSGSFQMAIAWKDLAHKVNADKFPSWMANASIDDLQALYHYKCQQLLQLTGK